MKNLLSFNYWFNLQPEPLIPLAWHFLAAIIIILAAASLFLGIFKKRGGIYHGWFNRLYAFSLFNVLIGTFVYFMNYEQIPFFMARFWIGLWLITMLVWFVLVAKKFKEIPAAKKKREEEKELKKYLP